MRWKVPREIVVHDFVGQQPQGVTRMESIPGVEEHHIFPLGHVKPLVHRVIQTFVGGGGKKLRLRSAVAGDTKGRVG